MDLNKLKPALAEEGVTMEVVHPETEETIEGMTITLLGRDSDVAKRIRRKRQDAALARVSKGKKGLDMTAEQLEEQSIEELVKLTKSWQGFELDGQPLECTDENKRKVFSGWEWLREQAEEFVSTRSHFFRKAD